MAVIASATARMAGAGFALVVELEWDLLPSLFSR